MRPTTRPVSSVVSFTVRLCRTKRPQQLISVSAVSSEVVKESNELWIL